MITKLKITYLFLNLIFVSLIYITPTTKVFAQENQVSEEDFTNAENAEENRIKWGTEEFKLELIKEMSSANIALFIDEHLKQSKNHHEFIINSLKNRPEKTILKEMWCLI